MKEKIVHSSGKRKTAVARATVRSGTGRVTINTIPLEQYSPKLAQMRIKESVVLADELAGKVDISVRSFGGGVMSQANAIRLAIARAMVEYSGNEKLEEVYLAYDRQLLVADVRRKEASKPNDSSARSKRQKSYR